MNRKLIRIYKNLNNSIKSHTLAVDFAFTFAQGRWFQSFIARRTSKATLVPTRATAHHFFSHKNYFTYNRYSFWFGFVSFFKIIKMYLSIVLMVIIYLVLPHRGQSILDPYFLGPVFPLAVLEPLAKSGATWAWANCGIFDVGGPFCWFVQPSHRISVVSHARINIEMKRASALDWPRQMANSK